MLKKYSPKLLSLIALLFMVMLYYSCRKLEYSPFQTDNSDKPSGLNAKNIARLMSTQSSADDTVIILYIGDSHRFYDQLNALLNYANTIPRVDFLILAGDITDFGILEQYITIYNMLAKLKFPYICAVGNHDLTSDGSDIYTQMFGEKNFSFTYKGYKFLFHDTNGREYKFSGTVPNLWWISDELKDTVPKWFIGVSHVPPYNEDFDRSLERPYKDLLASNPKFILSMHGHVHFASDGFYYNDSVRYMTCNSVEKKNSILLKLINGKIIRQMIPF